MLSLLVIHARSPVPQGVHEHERIILTRPVRFPKRKISLVQFHTLKTVRFHKTVTVCQILLRVTIITTEIIYRLPLGLHTPPPVPVLVNIEIIHRHPLIRVILRLPDPSRHKR